MTRSLRGWVVVVGLTTSPVWAQDETTDTQTEDVNLEIGMPGMDGFPGANMNVNVKVQQTSTKSVTSERSSVEPASLTQEEPDCGAGKDPGCTMRRNFNAPMDAETFRGFIESLRANNNEINRVEIARSTLEENYLTARQLGLVLDLFENEIYRFDVAKMAAPRLVNPKHALGLSSKFTNSIFATDYTRLMNAQR
ncbi:MAG: DUF4476 domain-containing protein [Myxococcaceae bacterium]